MSSFVIIWEQNMYSNKKKNIAHEWPGHAAINIGEAFEKPRVALNGNYASWLPSANIGSFGVKGFFKRNKEASWNFSIAEDIVYETYLPDHVIKLDTDAAKENAMQAEWNAIRNKKNASYAAFRKNCSTIVSRILHAGGFYSRKWAENNNWVWAPSDIRQLATSAGGTFMKWKDVRTILSASGLNAADWGQIWLARSGAFCTTGAPVYKQKEGYKVG